MTKVKRRDLILLIIYPFFASFIAFLFNINFFFSILVLFGVPSLFLSFRAKEYVRHSFIFSILFAVPIATFFEYMADFTHTWFIPYSVFAFRFMGHVAIEQILWGIFLTYLLILFYRYFVGNHVPNKIYVRYTTPLIVFEFFSLLIFFILILFNPSSLNIPYFFLMFGIVIVLVPLSISFLLFKKMRYTFIKVGLYFFVFNCFYEVIALKLRWWEFPRGGQFVGWVTFWGVTFPFEEFFFWIMLGAPSILAWYKLFGEERKKFFG